MLYLTIIGGAFIAWLILVFLFTPAIPYHIEAPIDTRSDHFIHVLESTCHSTLERDNKVEILTDGTMFYPAMLDAIRGARETVNMECYIFKRGEIGNRFIEALADRARAGVRVTIVMDAVGSFGAFHRSARPLREAGCRIEPYQRMRWYSLARLNNRTHRELLVVDGQIAFVGGAGVADWWWKPGGKRHRSGRPMWRDMMARIEGPVVADIQGVVADSPWADEQVQLARMRTIAIGPLTIPVLPYEPALVDWLIGGQLEDALHGAGLDDYFDVLLSADQARSYKTAPAVYELGPLTLGHPATELLLVSSNGWDVIGAKWYGYRSFWVNRSSAPLERLGERPDGIGRTLNDAVDFALELHRGGR